MLQLDAVQTLAFAGLALFLGYALCRTVPFLSRYNLPPPVIGGLLAAGRRCTRWIPACRRR